MEKGKEYEIKIIERDKNKKYAIAKINKEEVKIEKVNDEEIENLKKILKNENYKLIIEKVKELIDPEFLHPYSFRIIPRMRYYFGNERRFSELEKLSYEGYLLKYKGNYFFVEISWSKVPTIYWLSLVPDKEIKKIRKEYPKEICEEFSAIIEYIMFPKYKIEVVCNNRYRRLVIVKINGEEVKIEGVSDEESEKFYELKKKLGYEEIQATLPWPIPILFKEKDLKKEKPLAIYRLLLNFGLPSGAGLEEDGCSYYLKYKGNYFFVVDRIFGEIEIKWHGMVPKEIYEKYRFGEGEEAEKIREQYPPKEICEEFSAIIEYIVRNPAKVFIEDGYMLF